MFSIPNKIKSLIYFFIISVTINGSYKNISATIESSFLNKGSMPPLAHYRPGSSAPKNQKTIKKYFLKSIALFAQSLAHELGHAAAAKAMGLILKKIFVIPPNPYIGGGYVQVEYTKYSDEFHHLFHKNPYICACRKMTTFYAAGPAVGLIYNYILLKLIGLITEYKKRGKGLKALKYGLKKSINETVREKCDSQELKWIKEQTIEGIWGQIIQCYPVLPLDGGQVVSSLFTSNSTLRTAQIILTPLTFIASSLGLRRNFDLPREKKQIKQDLIKTICFLTAMQILKE